MAKNERVNIRERSSGVLMPVFSLPSEYGIGDFGDSAFRFIDFLAETGQRYWQILPLCPTSYGDSPYQSPASFAGNPYFIDLYKLYKDGLLTRSELEYSRIPHGRIDYGRLFKERYLQLRIAFSRFKPDDEYRVFLKSSKGWLDDYALFMSLKIYYGYKPWTEWRDEHRIYSLAKKDKKRFESEMSFWRFVQYEFARQWSAVRNYANKKGVLIIGDMPIYVAHDSMDVWRSPEEFLLDEDFNPVRVAGCPPDAYAEDGQLWGNPIYNWDYMRSNGFRWWCERVKRGCELYDVLRIDHFRGFSGYYSIPYGDSNARRGEWCEAPGKELFSKLKRKFGDGRIIAEDLGFITDDVRELLEYTDFPGMKMLQFAFYTDDSEYLARSFKSDNSVVYVSSHDSDLAFSWYRALDRKARKRFKSEVPRIKGKSPVWSLLSYAHNSRANISIILLQDIMEMSNEQGRINIPSVAEGNWTFRFSHTFTRKSVRDKLCTLTKEAGRYRVE